MGMLISKLFYNIDFYQDVKKTCKNSINSQQIYKLGTTGSFVSFVIWNMDWNL